MRRKSSVNGLTPLRRKLRRMPDDVTNVVKAEIKDGMETLHFRTLTLIPVDTGDLAQALRYKIESDGLRSKFGFWSKGNQKAWRLAGWRAHFVEFGTRGYTANERRPAGRGKTKIVRRNVPARPAQPFMGPAWRMTGPTIVANIKREVNKALERAARL